MARTGRSRRLGLEALEPRTLLSGNVTAVVTGGNLVITGDAQDNDIVIDQVGLNPGEFQIDSGADATTINGTAGAKVFQGVTKDVRINTGDGNDVVTLNDSSLPRSLIMTGGEGNNRLEGTRVDIGTDLSYIGQDDGDEVVLMDAAIGRDLKAALGDGAGSFVIVDPAVLPANTVGRHLRVTGSYGDDFVDVIYTEIGGSAAALLGGGFNRATLRYTSVGGALTYKGGDGEDRLTLDGTDVLGACTMDMGAGDNTTSLGVGGPCTSFTYRGGDGSDDVYEYPISGGCQVTGPVRITLGHGANSFGVGLHVTGPLARVAITGGHGVDHVQLSGGRSDGPVVMNLKGGEDHVRMEGGSYERTILVNMGDGADSVTLEETTVIKLATLNLGGGENTLIVDDTLVDGPCRIIGGTGHDTVAFDRARIQGKTTVTSRAGNDEFSAASSTLEAVAVKFGNGDGKVAFADSSISNGLSARLGTGKDSFELDTVNCIGPISVLTGHGVDSIAVNDCNLSGSFTVDTGNGADTIDIEVSGPAVSNFYQPVTIRTGRGMDVITIGVAGDPTLSAIFHVPLLLDGGPGYDLLDAGIVAGHNNGNGFNGLTTLNFEELT